MATINFNFSASEINLFITNFTPLPETVGVDVDVQLLTEDQNGVTKTDVEGEFDFVSDQINNIDFARSSWRQFTINQGFATEYTARNDISTNLTGQFNIPANSEFSFLLLSSINLTTFTTNPTANNLSSSGNISIALQNSSTQEIIDSFNLLAVINTSFAEEIDKDYFRFSTSPNFTVIHYKEDFLSLSGSQGNLKSFNVNNAVIFRRYFEEPVMIDFVALTQSCNYTSTNINTCVKVDEPSYNIALILLLFLLTTRTYFSRIMKYIINLTD